MLSIIEVCSTSGEDAIEGRTTMSLPARSAKYAACGLLVLALSAAAAGAPAAGTPAAGGPVQGETTPATERTSVAVVLEAGRLPEIEAMQGWFVVEGEAQRVLAVEEGPAEVAMVRDPAAQDYFDILARAFLERELLLREWRRAEEENRKLALLHPSARPQQAWDPRVLQQDENSFVEAGRPMFRTTAGAATDAELRSFRAALQGAFTLGEGARLHFIEAQAAPVSRTARAMSVFNLSPSFPSGTDGFLSFVERVPTLQFELRFADAVFIAAQDLYARAVRRAVVVVIEGQSEDRSLHSGDSVREFARRLQVPVFVWSFGPGAFVADWGGRLIGQQAGHLDTPLALVNFEDVWEDLREELDAQRIVWIEGRHRPSRVRLGEAATGIRLAGRGPVGSIAAAGRETLR